MASILTIDRKRYDLSNSTPFQVTLSGTQGHFTIVGYFTPFGMRFSVQSIHSSQHIVAVAHGMVISQTIVIKSRTW